MSRRRASLVGRFAQAREIAGKLPQTQCIYVADSEADIYELLCEPRKLGQSDKEIDWLIRACQNRALACEGESEHRYLREQVLASAPLYEMELLIRAHQAKTQVEERARRGATVARREWRFVPRR